MQSLASLKNILLQGPFSDKQTRAHLTGAFDRSRCASKAVIAMKSNELSKRLDRVERLSELARQREPGAQPPRLHEDWEADFERMNEDDAAHAELVRRELERTNGVMGQEDPEVLRAYEEYQASLGDGLNRDERTGRATQNREYVFHPDNPFLESANPYQEGVALYGAGKLNEAVLAFEAALRHNPNDSNCWRLLGTCYAENDDDIAAIVPLKRSVEADPSNLEALLELGVSFTNELEEAEALRYLHSWLLNHPDFKHVPGDLSVDSGHVRDMFLRASEFAPKDPDVWAVLGVLYNLSREYDLAIDAFEMACALDPTNYSLFNKLGATLANSSNPDGAKSAVKAYRKALELKPNYVRSWANMGISFANQGSFQNAAKYYLKALSLNENADHLWGYLRFTFSCMGRPDLVQKSDARNLALFKDEFRFTND